MASPRHAPRSWRRNEERAAANAARRAKSGHGPAPGQAATEPRRQSYRGGKPAYLLARGSITPAQHDAGMAWIHDWRSATGGPGSPLAGEVRAGGVPDLFDAMCANSARGRRFLRMGAALGQALALVVFQVFAQNRDPAEIARERQERHNRENPETPRKVHAKMVAEVLRVGLDELADLYRDERP